MKLVTCSREDEVARAMRGGQWPDACEPELREHVEACGRCIELVEVGRCLRQERAIAMREARLPSASALWWRARLAHQQQAATIAIKPVAWAERIGVFVAILSMVGVVAWQRNWIHAWLSWFTDTAQATTFWFEFSNWMPLLVAVGGGVVVFVTALAFYFWAEDY